MSLMKSYRDAEKAAAYGRAAGHDEAINEEKLRNQERDAMLRRYETRLAKWKGPFWRKRPPFVYVQEPALNDDYIRLVVRGESVSNIWSVNWADRPVTFFRNPLRRLAPRVRKAVSPRP